MLISLSHDLETHFIAYLNKIDKSLPAVEFCIDLELAKAYRAEGTIWEAIFELTIASIHRTLIVYAVLQTKHVADLMNHR